MQVAGCFVTNFGRSAEADIVVAEVEQCESGESMKLVADLPDLGPAIAEALFPEPLPLGDDFFVEAQPFDFFVGVGGDEVEDEGGRYDCHLEDFGKQFQEFFHFGSSKTLCHFAFGSLR